MNERILVWEQPSEARASRKTIVASFVAVNLVLVSDFDIVLN